MDEATMMGVVTAGLFYVGGWNIVSFEDKSEAEARFLEAVTRTLDHYMNTKEDWSLVLNDLSGPEKQCHSEYLSCEPELIENLKENGIRLTHSPFSSFWHKS